MRLKAILQRFQVEGRLLDISPYGDGHINDTYFVRFLGSGNGVNPYVFQCINQSVFKKPGEVMHNMERVTAYVRDAASAAGRDPARATVSLIPTLNGRSWYRAPDGSVWRLSQFIAGARTYQRALNPEHNYYAGNAFGEFLVYLKDFPVDDLYVTIPDFHHTPKRYQAFLGAVDGDYANRANTARVEIDFITCRESLTSILMDLVAAGEMPERVTHNDTKIDNVMIDDATGEGVCVIDLDTVMPGLTVFDFGDSVRSGANTAAEDEADTARVAFDLSVFDRLAHGFLDAARDMLTPLEIDYLAFGARLITLEQGIRFLTDYLNGDTYYKTTRPGQNLDRARTQLKLVAEMESRGDQMEEIIAKYR